MSDIGFIGLGIMGSPMAARLAAAGHVLNLKGGRRPLPQTLIEGGARACATAREVAERSSVVFLMVPDTPQVEEVLFAADGVAAGIARNTIVVDMSSIAPLATRDFARRIGEKGCAYLDAPVSGGEVGARAGTLTIMVGGPQEAFDQVRPLFELMGKTVTLVGGNGDGQVAKVANQIIVALNIAAVAEALVFAGKAGADPARIREALMGGFASSKVLEVHGERMLRRSFQPGFRVELHQKDLAIALDGARALGVALPGAAAAQQLFSACVAAGEAGADHSALVKALERLAAHEIG